MKFESVLEKLKPLRPMLHDEFGVSRLSVFGSVARDEGRISSDIDILVDFDGSPSFAGFMELKFFLEETLGFPVDLVTRNGLRAALRKKIEGEARDVA